MRVNEKVMMRKQEGELITHAQVVHFHSFSFSNRSRFQHFLRLQLFRHQSGTEGKIFKENSCTLIFLATDLGNKQSEKTI